MFRRPDQGYDEQWGYFSSSYETIRPPGANSTYGPILLTPGNNVKGDYVSAGPAIGQDVFKIEVGFHGGASSGQARDMLCDVGIDPAGGSNFLAQPPLIPNLISSCAQGNNAGGSGFLYTFPLFIKAGSTLAIRASINNATVGNIRASVAVYGAPRSKINIKAGSAVRDYGTFVSASSGTSVTPGEASIGAWYQLGTVAAGDRPWWWQCAAGFNNSAIALTTNYWQDLSIGSVTSRRFVIKRQKLNVTTAEALWVEPRITDCEYQASPGDILYGRSQCASTADAGYAMACWGVVG